VTARVPLIACVAVLAFFAGITGVRLHTRSALCARPAPGGRLHLVAPARSQAPGHQGIPGRLIHDGGAVRGDLTVKNESGLRLPYCEVRDGTKLPGYAPGRAFALAAGGSVTWTARGMFNLAACIASDHSRHASGILRAVSASHPCAPENEVDRLPGDPRPPAQRSQWAATGLPRPIVASRGCATGRWSTIRDYRTHDGLSRMPLGVDGTQPDV